MHDMRSTFLNSQLDRPTSGPTAFRDCRTACWISQSTIRCQPGTSHLLPAQQATLQVLLRSKRSHDIPAPAGGLCCPLPTRLGAASG